MAACLTGILRWNKQQSSAKPCQLVGKLPPELKPALIQYGLVQSRFYMHIFPRMVKRTGGRTRHILHFQVFNHDKSVVFAD